MSILRRTLAPLAVLTVIALPVSTGAGVASATASTTAGTSTSLAGLALFGSDRYSQDGDQTVRGGRVWFLDDEFAYRRTSTHPGPRPPTSCATTPTPGGCERYTYDPADGAVTVGTDQGTLSADRRRLIFATAGPAGQESPPVVLDAPITHCATGSRWDARVTLTSYFYESDLTERDTYVFAKDGTYRFRYTEQSGSRRPQVRTRRSGTYRVASRDQLSLHRTRGGGVDRMTLLCAAQTNAAGKAAVGAEGLVLGHTPYDADH